MSCTAVIFPGQGSQFVEMAYDLPKGALVEVDKVLGYSLSKLMESGPEPELMDTSNAQPAILAHSIILWQLVSQKIVPSYFAGHSLGEYSAVVAGGGLDFYEALKLVHFRGKCMKEAVPTGIGGMVAVLGCENEVVEKICIETSEKNSIVEPANYNAKGQIVVSGHIEALVRFEKAVKSAGARRVVKLSVSSPFHSSLMEKAEKKLEKYLDKVHFRNLKTPVINNVDVEVLTDSSSIKESLVRQVSGSVKWTQTVQKLLSLGVDNFIEVGSGSVLCGLIKKIDKQVKCISISKVEDIAKIL